MWDSTQTSSNLPQLLHINEIVEPAYEYIKGRANGSIVSAKSKFFNLNRCLMGGFELNTITTIAALSGAGKSTLAKELRHSIATSNPSLKFKHIVFNFEMTAIAQINREIATKTKKQMSNLYSVDSPLADSEIKTLKQHYEALKNQDVYFIETALTSENLVLMLYMFWVKYCKEGNYTMIYEIDNLMLIDGPDEKEKIDKTNYKLVALKKQISSEGGSSIGFVLTQMNRNIASVERVSTPELHKPMASDLMSASSTNFCSDYIIFAHIPAKLGLKKYTDRKLPTKIVYPNNEIVDMAYMELVKNRTGQPNLTFALHNRLKYFCFDEMSKNEKKSIYGKDVILDPLTNHPLIKLE